MDSPPLKQEEKNHFKTLIINKLKKIQEFYLYITHHENYYEAHNEEALC